MENITGHYFILAYQCILACFSQYDFNLLFLNTLKLDEDLKHLPISVRVGNAVDTVG